MKKKMLAMLLALAMVLTSVPSTVYATGDSGTDDNAVTTEADGQTDDADATIVDTEEKENTPAATSEEGEEATGQNEDAWYDAEATEFVISSVEDLFAFAEAVNEGNNFSEKIVKLGADIDLAGNEWTPIGGYDASKVFSGTFDGGNHTIKNMTITKTDAPSAKVRLGLFSSIKDATIKNLVVEDATIKAESSNARAAVLVMTADGNSNTIENITIKGGNVNVKSGDNGYASGVVGWTVSISMSNINVSKLTLNVDAATEARTSAIVCYLNQVDSGQFKLDEFEISNVKLEAEAATTYVGGAFADVNKGKQKQCQPITNGTIENLTIMSNATSASNVGGLIGMSYKVDPQKVDSVKITGLDIDFTGSESKVGGVVGWDQSVSYDNTTKSGWYNDVHVTGTINENITSGSGSEVGGFVGVSHQYPKIYTNCSADVDIVTGNRAGGFVGTPCPNEWSGQTDAYTNCTASGDVTAPVAGGFVGCAWLNSGKNTTLLLDNVTATGKVTGNTHAGGLIGGAFGSGGCSNINIIDSVASENVTGPEGNTGGVVGNMSMASGKYLTLEDVSYTVEPAYNPATQKSNVKIIAHAAKIGDVKYDTLDEAINAASAGDEVVLLKDIDYGTNQLKIDKAITLDLGGKTLTTRNAYGGMSLKGNCTVKNGTIVHASNTAAIKVWNAGSFEDLVIDVQGKGDANKTIGGIVVQSGSTSKVGSIKNVTIKGEALTNGIETYNCGDATELVIDSMENVTIDANGTGMLISAPCGTATNCDIKGGTSGIEIWIKGTYSATLDLKGCIVEGGEQAFYAHDEFNSNPDIENKGELKLTIDDETFNNIVGAPLKMIIARAENVHIDEKLLGEAKVGDTYYDSLSKAIGVANAIEGGATVTLLKDVTLAEKLTISGNVTISGKHTITRGDAYTGTLFAVNEGATLTLDGGLVVDGANEYVFDKEAYEADLADWENAVATADNAKWFTPEEGAPVATAYMITTSGTVNLNDVAIKNHYSTNGSGIVSASKGANVTLDGAQITHNASTNGSGLVVNASTNVYSREEELITVTMNEGTVIDGNHVGGNHGIFKIYMGTYFTMNGGEIKNTTGWNSNGTVVGIYYGVFTMNGGTICSNSSVYGPNNGRNAAIYGHSNHLFTMNGGTICHNTGRSKAGIDSPFSETGYIGQTFINGGTVVDNTVLGSWTEPDVSGGATLTVSGGTYTQDVSKYLAPDTGLVYDEETGRYTVTNHVYNLWFRDPSTGEQVPGVGPLQGNNLAELIETGKLFYADYYDMELEVLSNVKVDETAVIDYPMTINLNGHTITGAAKEGVQVYPVIRVQGGADVIVKGEGGITNADYVFVVGASDGSTAGNLTIESGKYKGQTTVASVTKGTLTIKGGEFSINEEAETYDYAYVLNCVDANYKDDSAKIEVTGGTFHKFNPAENAAEGTGTNFVPEKYESTYDEEADTYSVVEKIVAKIGETGYTTLADALANAKSGETVYMVADHEDKSAATIIPAGVTLDLKGKVVEAKNVLAFGTVIDTADVVGGIKISNDTTEAIVHLQPENAGYLPIYDTTEGCYKFFKAKFVAYDYSEEENGNVVKARFFINFDNYEGYKVLANADYENLKVVVDLYWTGLPEDKTIEYVISEESVKLYSEKQYDHHVNNTGKTTAMYLKITGVNKLKVGDEIIATPKIVSETDVIMNVSEALEPYVK